jgi:predicted nucleic acid-binding protein
MIFVDTSGWYAAYAPTDPRHEEVKPLIDEARTRLITTDDVLSESLTLLRVHKEHQRGLLLGADLMAQASAELIHVTSEDVRRAWAVYSTYRDKDWSFVDCTSYVVMQRLRISEAISLDQHFHQMSGITVHPLL